MAIGYTDKCLLFTNSAIQQPGFALGQTDFYNE